MVGMYSNSKPPHLFVFLSAAVAVHGAALPTKDLHTATVLCSFDKTLNKH